MRKPTEEQKARTAEKRAKFRALVKEVSAMTDEQKAHLTNRLGAVPTCEGRLLSLHNTLLLLKQCPGVSLVGGFQQWKKAGRVVRKGEHGFLIWFPLGAGKADPNIPADAPADVQSSADNDRRFLMATVFDVTQTEPIDAEQTTATPTPAQPALSDDDARPSYTITDEQPTLALV